MGTLYGAMCQYEIYSGRYVCFFFGSRDVELVWTIFFLQPGYGQLLLQRNHCRLLRCLPLFWVMEEGSTQMFLLQVIDSVLVTFLSILCLSELENLTKGIPTLQAAEGSPSIADLLRSFYCGSQGVMEGHGGSWRVHSGVSITEEGWSAEVDLLGHWSERTATVPFECRFSVTINGMGHC